MINEFVIQGMELIEEQETYSQVDDIARKIIEIILISKNNLIEVLKANTYESVAFVDLISAIGFAALEYDKSQIENIKSYLEELRKSDNKRVSMAAEDSLDLLEFNY